MAEIFGGGLPVNIPGDYRVSLEGKIIVANSATQSGSVVLPIGAVKTDDGRPLTHGLSGLYMRENEKTKELEPILATHQMFVEIQNKLSIPIEVDMRIIVKSLNPQEPIMMMRKAIAQGDDKELLAAAKRYMLDWERWNIIRRKQPHG